MKLTHALSRMALIFLAGLPGQAPAQPGGLPDPAPIARPSETPGADSGGAQAVAAPIGLLLPPGGGDFGRAAAAVRAGFQAAHERDAATSAIEIVETADDAAALAVRYDRLAARGVAVMVGPLTRAGVNALAELGTLPMPTLTLNQPDADRPLPANALAFGLPIEGEARQLAQRAHADAAASGRAPARAVARAVIVSAPSPLARRAAAALYDAWREQGGVADLPAEFDSRAGAELQAQAELLDAEAVFVAGPADLVRAVRAALAIDAGRPAASGAAPAVYATSLMTVGMAVDRRLPDLDGVRVIEMPWLVAANRAAARTYAKPQGAMANTELQRLYALGIDAYRVAAELARGHSPIELDGMTGRLGHDGYARRVERVGVACEYRDGVPVPLDGR